MCRLLGRRQRLPTCCNILAGGPHTDQTLQNTTDLSEPARFEMNGCLTPFKLFAHRLLLRMLFYNYHPHLLSPRPHTLAFLEMPARISTRIRCTRRDAGGCDGVSITGQPNRTSSERVYISNSRECSGFGGGGCRLRVAGPRTATVNIFTGRVGFTQGKITWSWSEWVAWS